MVKNSNFSKTLDRALSQKKYNITAFSREVNVDRKTVYEWVGGEKLPRTEKLLNICSTLGINEPKTRRDLILSWIKDQKLSPILSEYLNLSVMNDLN